MIIVTNKVLWFNAAAITFYPFMFVAPDYVDDITILIHEQIHYNQQKNWAIYGLGVGLLLWYFLYLFCLPVWYNPFRRKWETEAYRKAQKYDDETITTILKLAPYYLK
jgi:predicted small integral membrane protein